MTNRADIVRIAREEVLDPTSTLARQLLASHELDRDERGRPNVARVHETHVYFRLRGVRFTFVVVVEDDECAGCYVEADTRVHLDVRSESIAPPEITRRVGFEPTRSRQRGDVIHGTVCSRFHSWSLELDRSLPGSVDEKLERLLTLVEPRADAFAALRPECTIQISVMYDNWRGDPQFGGMHFDEETVRRSAALGASIDVDLYASGSGVLE